MKTRKSIQLTSLVLVYLGWIYLFPMLFAALLSVGAPHLRTTNNDNNRPQICK